MAVELTKGSRFNLSKEAPNINTITINLGWQVSETEQNYDIDVSVFMLELDRKVPDEKYFIFYNNAQSPDGSLKHSGSSQAKQSNNEEIIYIDLAKVNPTVQEIVFVVTIHQAQEKQQNFSQVINSFIKISNEETEDLLACYNLIETFSQETALEFGRLYKKNDEWRFQAVGDGYNSGLQSFVDKYIDDSKQPKIVETEPIYQEETIKPQLIDITKKANINLLKKKVDIVLKKKGIAQYVARVALVLDISGSMLNNYTSGAVQSFLERIVPVSSRLDDDKELDVWFFGTTFKRTKPATEDNVDDYIKQECGAMRRALLFFKMPSLMMELGGGTNESSVILDVVKKYTQENTSNLPTLVVFLSDGGVTDNQAIKKAITDAAKHPIFWQFVGLGGSNYGILEKLDTMTGRVVDNANFFHVDDLAKITDEELYERMLNEFPTWLKIISPSN